MPLDELRARFGGPLPEAGKDPVAVVEELAANAEGGLVATARDRATSGSSIGGSVPAALAADWLTSAWDQNAGLYVIGPAAAVAEEVAGAWLAELFGLPAGVSVGLHDRRDDGVVHRARRGTPRAARARRLGRRARRACSARPRSRSSSSDESHVTIFAALQMLGMGRERVIRVATDDQGRMRADALREALAAIDRPALVCAQAGNVNTGGFDPLPAIVDGGPRERRLAPRRRRVRPVGGRRSRASRTSSRGSGTPTRGRPTPTSGSTCPTTPASRSSPTPRPTTPR